MVKVTIFQDTFRHYSRANLLYILPDMHKIAVKTFNDKFVWCMDNNIKFNIETNFYRDETSPLPLVVDSVMTVTADMTDDQYLLYQLTFKGGE